MPMKIPKRIFLSGKMIYLRALETDDLTDRYLQWLNDEEVCSGNGHAIFPNSRARMRNYLDSVHHSTSAVVLAIVAHKGDRHIGNASLQDIDWVSRSAAFAILIGDTRYWGQGIGLEVGRLIVQFGFERLNLNRVHCATPENNRAMQKLAATLGMEREGLRRQAFYKAGRYLDVVEYGVLRKDFGMATALRSRARK